MIKEASNHRVYNIDECVVFAKTDEYFGGLSNMAPGYPLYVNDNVIPSVEALYQSLRYPLFPNVQFEIIEQTSPMTAKMISKKNYPFSRQDWDEIRLKVMRWCLEVKLCQHWTKFSALLKETGNKPIVEYSRKDTIWGAMKTSDKQLAGINALGRLLMDIREKYVINHVNLVCVEPLNITGCLLFGYPIEPICNEEFYMNNPDFQAVEFLDLK